MRKITPTILLITLLFNFSGYLLFFFVSKMEIKSEMREEMREKIESGAELERIALPLSDYKKYFIEDHEIFVNNKLYDIAREEIKKDSIVFYCIHDHKEQQLMASLDNFSDFEDEAANNSSNSEEQLLSFLSQSSLIYQQNQLSKNTIYLASIQDITPVLQSQSITPNTQPPKGNLFA